MRALAPFPLQEDVLTTTSKRGASGQGGSVANRLTRKIEQWVQALVDQVTSRVQTVAVVTLTGVSDTVALTAFPSIEALPTGLYRASATALPYQGLSATAAISVTIEWTTQGGGWGATVCDRVFADGLAPDTGAVLMRIDVGTPVSYRVTYAPGTDPARYRAHLYLVLERLA